MKQTKRSLVMLTVAGALFISFSSFSKRPTDDPKKPAPFASYTISLVSVVQNGSNYVWTWSVTNPNPGNGNNGTLQNVSHWDMPLSADAESSLVSADYSFDAVNWTSSSIVVERDPSIRVCTGTDVLKFDVGTTGSAPTYYRVTLSANFNTNPFAQSWIKTGGGLQGCNFYFFTGIGARPQ